MSRTPDDAYEMSLLSDAALANEGELPMTRPTEGVTRLTPTCQVCDTTKGLTEYTAGHYCQEDAPMTKMQQEEWLNVPHTAGPWKVSQVDKVKGRAYVWTDRKYPHGACVAEVRSETILESELVANARLIASAPALLEACKWAEDALAEMDDLSDGEKDVLRNIRDAIRAAAGGRE